MRVSEVVQDGPCGVSGRVPEAYSEMLVSNRTSRRNPSDISVLVVDDEEPVARFVDRVLRTAGYSTARALDGAEAIEIASKLQNVDLLVTDVMMPNMTGDELARRLRQKEPGVKVLYLTGYSDCLFKQKSMLWEDEAFLDKPCSMAGLLEAVSLLLFGQFEPAVRDASGQAVS